MLQSIIGGVLDPRAAGSRHVSLAGAVTLTLVALARTLRQEQRCWFTDAMLRSASGLAHVLHTSRLGHTAQPDTRFQRALQARPKDVLVAVLLATALSRRERTTARRV